MGRVQLQFTSELYNRIYSFEYKALTWSTAIELIDQIIDSNGGSPDPSDPNYKDGPCGGYIQFRWLLSQKQDILLRKDYLVFNRDDRDGSHYAAFPSAILTGSNAFANCGCAFSVGWRGEGGLFFNM